MQIKLLRLYFISLILGVLVGIAGSAFREIIDILSQILPNSTTVTTDSKGFLAVAAGLISMVMVGLAYLGVRYFAPEAGGSGVQEIEGALLHLRLVHWHRLLPVKFFAGILALGAKMLLGREGPTIHIGGNLGEMLGSIAALSRRRRDSLIAAGAAAGLAVAFNAPLAGVIFVMEEMRNQFNYSFTSFTMVVISCLVATLMQNFLLGAQPNIPMSIFQFPALDAMWLFACFGFFVGFVALIFNKYLMRLLFCIDNLSAGNKLVYALVIGFAVGFLAIYFPALVGGGDEIIHQALTLSLDLKILIILFVLRFIGTLACYATGVPGGIFAPVLALGTLFGLAVFNLFQLMHLDFYTQPGMFAVAGMAALFAGVTRSPITGGVLVVEMTQNYSLIFPVMMACITATIVLQLARNAPIYEQLLQRTLKNSQAH
ncbi:MAG: H(+)/Cl(-) exchange transporter ClcA [Legionella sp.]|nr:H(+)/Cl(-) exchange transporter ClcA [Legionella sp.]